MDLEIAAQKIEALTTLADNTLDSIELSIQAEITKQSRMQLNPVKLLGAVENSRRQLDELKKEAASISKLQEDLKTQLTESCNILCKKFGESEKRTGAENSLSSNAGSVMKSHLKM